MARPRDELAAARMRRIARAIHGGGGRRRVDIGDVVVYDPTGERSRVHGVWQDGAYLRVAIDHDGGQAWVLSSQCSLDRSTTEQEGGMS